MKKDFKSFVRYIRDNRLDEMAARNLANSKTLDIPLMRLFKHLTDEQILEMGRPATIDFLISIEEGTFWEKAEVSYQQWKEDKLKDISKHDIHPSDIVLINGLRKKGLFSFLTDYTTDINEIRDIVNEMDDFFMECDRTGMEVIYFIQKETENKFKDSEERYRDLFENANDLIHIADIEGNVLFANKSWLKITGYSLEKLPNILQKVIHPDYLSNYIEERKRVIEGKEPREFDFAIQTSSGKKVYLEGTVSCHFINGKADSIRGMFTDITEKRIQQEKLKIYTDNLIESEKRYRLLVENVKDYAIFMISPEGYIMSWNNGAEKIIGYESAEIIGRNISIFYPQNMEDVKAPEYQLTMAKQNGEFKTQSIRKKKDGSHYWADIVLTALYDNDGNIKSFLKIIRDITEIKEAEDLIKASQRKLQAIFDHAPDAIIVSDMDRKIVSWNKAAEKMYGYTFDEVVGRYGAELLPTQFSAPYTMELARKEMDEKGSWEGEATTVNKAGEKIVIIASATTLYDEAGNPTGVLAVNKDISERKKVDEKIAKTLKLLNEAEQVAHFGSWEKNINTNEIAWSDELFRIYGLKRKENQDLWEDFFKYIHPDDKELVVASTEKALIEKLPVSVNYRINTAKGHVRSLKANFSVVSYPNDSEIKLTGTVQDITEQKAKDDKIAKALQQLNEAQRMAHIGSWEMDLKTNLLTWSDEMYRIYGMHPFDHDPLNDAFKKYTYPDDINYVTNLVTKAIKNKQSYTFDYRITDAHGNPRIVQANGSIVCDAEGNAIKMTGTLQDITERKEANDKLMKSLQQLNEAQQMAHIGSWEWDVKTNVMNFSQELYRIFGVLSKDFAGNYEGYLNCVHPNDRNLVNDVFTKARENKQPFKFDHKVYTKDDSIKIVNSHGVVFMDAEGNVEKMSGTAQDITERVLSKEELKRAEETVKAKQQFLSNMSHEIRTPLNSIIGFTKVVLKSNLNHTQREYLDAIKLSGQTLLVLINDILDLAKVDSGKMVFEKIPFRLSSSVSSMLHLFDSKVQEKNIKLVNEYDHRIPEVLLGDPVRFHQIILNLISNAIKFTHKGKVVMKSTLIAESPEDVKVEFVVSDTGIGIHEDKLDNIFENFQQGSSSTGRLYGGTGLGLAIVKQLVTQQEGKIEVKSTVNKGTTFTFQLTFKKAGAEQIVEVEEEMDDDYSLKNIRVLVVEDVDLNQLLMKAILDDFEYDYDIAENGIVAIQKLKAEKYDIVLMDLQMPEMNGFEATEYIRTKMSYPTSEIPIMALTADVTTVDLEKCIAVGMNDYVTKPIDEKQLFNKINKLLKQPFKAEDELEEAKEDRGNIREKCINLEYLRTKVKGNSELMKEMIKIYLEQTPDLVKRMRESFEKEDWVALHKIAHRIIPSFSMVGIDVEFEEMARRIQEFAILQDRFDEIHQMIIKVERVCLQACRELEAEYKMFFN